MHAIKNGERRGMQVVTSLTYPAIAVFVPWIVLGRDDSLDVTLNLTPSVVTYL